MRIDFTNGLPLPEAEDNNMHSLLLSLPPARKGNGEPMTKYHSTFYLIFLLF